MAYFQKLKESKPFIPRAERILDNLSSILPAKVLLCQENSSQKVDEYFIYAEIGRGSFGTVYFAKRKSDNILCAVKISKPNNSSKRQMEGEVRFYNWMKNKFTEAEKEHISSLILATIEPNQLTIILKLYPRSLYDHIRANNFKPSSLSFTQKIMRGIIKGVKALHSHNIVHLDLKPENVLLDKKSTGEYNPVISDFGSVADVSKIKTSVICQTAWYRAPEVILRLKVGTPADIWSLGCIAAELAIGVPIIAPKIKNEEEEDLLRLMEVRFGPFPLNLIQMSTVSHRYFVDGRTRPINQDEKIDAVFSGNYSLETIIARLHQPNREETKLFCGFLKELLTYDPEQRPDIEKVSDHPFLFYNFD